MFDEMLTKALEQFTGKFGPGEYAAFVSAAMTIAKQRTEEDYPHLVISGSFSWSSKYKPEPKKKATANAPTLFS